MSNRRISQPGILPEKPTLSICMIVRNEEEVLPCCLRSVHGIADELIIVDTGSGDNSVSTAKDLGTRAVAINPELAAGHSKLGSAYKNKGMLDESIAELNLALALSPGDANAHTNLGVTYTEIGVLDEAIAHLKKATAINSDFALAHNNLAVAYCVNKQYRLAVKHCDKAIKLGFKVHPGFCRI